ncbi:HNH endonuclease [Comamonas sp.]|jgi:predicted restriction endonuclease|uniref:HNH endonuclease n=1 Tax=Comamonas sp. TaxID=34028 RepID=UPI002649B73E|nr:HNH endonuclease [Comamonas sp.]MDN5537353.1 HNH endonuclease [Comamonas sp.]
MAKLIQLSETSWEQPFRDRKKEHVLWGSHPVVREHCQFVDGTRRLLQISFDPRFDLDVVDYFQITSGREIQFPQALVEMIRPIVLENPESSFVVTVLDAEEYEDGQDSKQDTSTLITSRATTIMARVGQQKFRKQVMAFWGDACALSGVDVPTLLIASHIVPWSKSDADVKLDPFNGLLLAPHYDRLFDQGLISFSDEGSILLSPTAKRLAPDFGLSATMKLRKIHPKHLPYLATHRESFGYDK